jgi:hypothetical protein
MMARSITMRIMVLVAARDEKWMKISLLGKVFRFAFEIMIRVVRLLGQ